MALEVEQSADLNALQTCDLQLTFRYERDRWRHELSVRGESGWQTVLMSIEGLPDQVLPPSPSFQDLRLERIDDETAEFQLFGQAGKAVYSAAVRFNGRSQSISFDVAARAQQERAERSATSQYDLSPPVVVSTHGPSNRISLSAGCGALIVSASRPEISGPNSLRTETGPGRSLVIEGHSAATSGNAVPPRNARWQYAVLFEPLP